jgi:hypothetical protein
MVKKTRESPASPPVIPCQQAYARFMGSWGLYGEFFFFCARSDYSCFAGSGLSD